MNEFEALTNLANGPIIFTYYSESELSTSTLQYEKRNANCLDICEVSGFLYSIYKRHVTQSVMLFVYINANFKIFMKNHVT